jgi:hypothetical protein
MAQSAYDKTIMGGPPYFDDYDEDKRFLKILFRPGRPLQSRELTQLQSMLQNQIERFGRHMFEEGSVVTGGSITDATVNFIRVTDSLTLEQRAALVGSKLKSNDESSAVNATIIGVEDVGDANESNDNFYVIALQYITAGSFSASESLSTFGLNHPNLTLTVKAASTGSTDPEPTGTISNYVTMDEAIFFTNGYFVLCEKVRIAAHATDTTNSIRDFTNTTCSVGFDIVKETINADEDSTLDDPAFGFYNYTSPGADRYKINLAPTIRTLSGSGDAFGLRLENGEDYIELVRVINGNVSKKVRYPEYAGLADTLARRTFDESGNYTVRPFQLSFLLPSAVQPNTFTAGSLEDNSKSAISVSSGKAYLNGYEYEASGNNLFIIDRSRSTFTTGRANLPFNNHYDVQTRTPTRQVADAGNTKYFNFKNFDAIIGGQKRVYLLDSTGLAVGSCYIQQVLSNLGESVEDSDSGLNERIVFQLFQVRALGEQDLASAKYIAENYKTAPSGSNLPSGDLNSGANFTDTTTLLEFFIWTLDRGAIGSVDLRKGNARYFEQVRVNVPANRTRPRFMKNLKFRAIKSFVGTTDSNGDVTFSSNSNQIRFASDTQQVSTSSDRGTAFAFDSDYVVIQTENAGSVIDDPYNRQLPSPLKQFTINVSNDGTRVTIAGLKTTDGTSAYASKKVVLSAPMVCDYNIDDHTTQTVVRKGLDFRSTARLTQTDTISQDALNYCDSDGDGFLDGSDKIFLSKQFLYNVTSVSIGGNDIRLKIKQREATEQGRSSQRGAESSRDSRVERAFIQLEPNEKVQISGDLSITYNYYPTPTYADGSNGEGEMSTPNSYRRDESVSEAKNPEFDDHVRAPYILSQLAEYGANAMNHIDYRGYEYVSTLTNGNGSFSDDADSPQYEFNRAYAFGKDKTGGFLPVGFEGAESFHESEFYNSTPATVYLDSDRTVKISIGEPALKITDYPNLSANQMRIADLNLMAYGLYASDVAVTKYDNQRTTMTEINEIEQDIVENEKYDRIQALEQEAYTEAKSYFPNFNPVDHSTFVDSFEDWRSAWTTNNKGFNSSIDIFEESLRPNFTTFFTTTAITASNSDSHIQTSDGIIMPAGVTVDFIRTDTSNENATPTDEPLNPNGVVDFHGFATATPFTDAYWNQSLEPAVFPVNGKVSYDPADDRVDYVHPTFGDVFRKNGSGVNVREHELNWYGVPESEIDPPNIDDTSNYYYRRTRKPRSVKRALNAKQLRRENTAGSATDKVVDDSIRFKGRNFTVTVSANGLKPNTEHRVFQTDDTGSRNIPIGRGSIAIFTTGAGGTASFNFEHPEVLSGEEYYLITDAFDADTKRFNGIINSTSSADFFIQNTGLYQTEEMGIKGIRPLKPRRDSSNLGTYNNRYYDNLPITGIAPYNAFTPVTQTFTVDVVDNPLGIFLDSIDLYFKQVPSNDVATLPVTVRIHPVVDGVPNYNYVLPFSETSQVVTAARDSFQQDTDTTRFTFSSPVILSPGKYALAIETNESSYVVHTATTSEAVEKPINVNELYFASNNGENQALLNEFIRFKMNRMQFTPAASGQAGGDSKVNFTLTFSDYGQGTATNGGDTFKSAKSLVVGSFFFANAPRLFVNDPAGGSIRHDFRAITDGGGAEVDDATNPLAGEKGFNKTFSVLDSTKQGAITDINGKVDVRARLGVSVDQKVANVVDLDRLALIANRFNLNNDQRPSNFGFDVQNKFANGFENRPDDSLGTSLSRYYSKAVYIEDSASDLVVSLEGYFPEGSRPVVLAQVGETLSDMEQSDYFFCTYLGNDPANRGSADVNYLDDQFPISTEQGEGDIRKQFVFKIKPVYDLNGGVAREIPTKFDYYRIKVLMVSGGSESTLQGSSFVSTQGPRIYKLSAIAGSEQANVINATSQIGDEGFVYLNFGDIMKAIPFNGEGTGGNLLMTTLGDAYSPIEPLPDFMSYVEGGADTQQALRLINNGSVPMTFKIDFDFTTHGANSASDASINYQETAALLTDIVPGDANDTNFTIIFNSNTTIGDFDPIYGESMPADFGNDTFGHISSFKPSKIVTLQPGERRYYRLIGTSREGSNQAITRALHIISGGYAVRRIK